MNEMIEFNRMLIAEFREKHGELAGRFRKRTYPVADHHREAQRRNSHSAADVRA